MTSAGAMPARVEIAMETSPSTQPAHAPVRRRSLFIACLAMGTLMLALTGLKSVVAGPTDPTSQPAATAPVAPLSVAPADQAEWLALPMRVLDLPGTETYLSTSTRAMVETISIAVEKSLPPLADAQAAGDVSLEGGFIFVYHDMKMDGMPFKLEIGGAVLGKPKAIEGYSVRKLDGIHAATTIYTGPAKHLTAAYSDLYAQIRDAKYTPTGECRETYFHWEGPDSVNNVVMIAVGLK